MLLREEPDGAVTTIAQPAHAALAGRLAEAWDDELAPAFVTAVGRHDDVWLERDATPWHNAATGRPQCFLELSPQDRVAIWGRAPVVAGPLGPAAELWVLRHAARIHEGFDDPRVMAMTTTLSDRIGVLAERLRAEGPGFDDPDLARGTSLLALLDRLSLRLCAGVHEPVSAGVLRLTPAGADAGVRTPAPVVAVAPWPFTQRRVDAVVEARRLPGRVADQAALDAAWAAAELVALPVALVPAG